MLVQAFVDESGGKGQSRHMVLAGVVASAYSWVGFSKKWKACLDAHPTISKLKMSEAAALSGAFGRFSESARDAKLRDLARVINRHVSFMVSSVIRMESAELHITGGVKPFWDPYFLPFHTLIMGICFDLWDHGIREQFEIVFDEHVIFGPRAHRWYPLMKEIVRCKEPEAAQILPVDPLFRTDDEFVPLQAADLFAWCIRRNTDNPAESAFEWLLSEMPNVKSSNYGYFMDEERFRVLNSQTQEILRNGSVPPHLQALWNEIRES